MLILLISAIGRSQISPGDLTTSHANLEGMSNCTLCHDIGKKVSNTKCLDCHDEIQSLLNANKGFHSSRGVVNKDCFECHSEHHGRKFDMVRFNENDFNHNLTGYKLEGAHEVIDCKKCHTPDYITDNELRGREGTFLGLNTKCLSCHDDFHQQTLSNDCLACHNMEAFKPASNFNHNDTNYPLKGKHLEVDCIECHDVTTRNGKKFYEFSDLSYSDCKSCHADPHNNQIPGRCNQCHVESSFSDFRGKGRFNHNSTGFGLKGEHNKLDCFSCHQSTNSVTSIFQDNKNVAENDCIACHSDTHDGKFGTDCAKCHNELSFLALNDMDFFDHTVTDYPLEGKHLEVDCKLCHTDRFSTPIDFSECKNCHTDYHNGEFVSNGKSPDCIECHTLEKGFDYTLYGLDEHQSSTFPLEGAHVATPCFACHISEDDERWTFANLGSQCIDCHLDIHENYISDAYYPDKSCTTCHVNGAWNLVTFDHNLTDWPLEGQHMTVNCRECHFEISENESIISQNFANLETQCASCHENVHDDLFAINGVTDCNRCHITDHWIPEKFDHDLTAFPLEGRHSEIDCKACHEIMDESGATTVLYKLNKLQCIDCHQ